MNARLTVRHIYGIDTYINVTDKISQVLTLSGLCDADLIMPIGTIVVNYRGNGGIKLLERLCDNSNLQDRIATSILSITDGVDVSGITSVLAQLTGLVTLTIVNEDATAGQYTINRGKIIKCASQKLYQKNH